MSTENLENQQQEQQQEPVEQKQETNPIEDRARELGWRPKEEFHGDEEQFIDAAEFVRRQPLFEKIEHMGRELKETKKVLTMLQEHHSKVKETEYARALNELKTQKKLALEEGDADKLIIIDDAMADLREQQQLAKNRAEQQEEEPRVDPKFVEWQNQNKWYKSNSEMRDFADVIGVKHAHANPHKSPEDVLKYVESQVRRAYPEAFTNPKRTQPSNVEGSAPSGKSTKIDDIELSDDERKAMLTFERAGIMTKEEYKKQLRAVRGN